MAPLRHTAPSYTLQPRPGSLSGLWQVAAVWVGRHRSRQALASLDPHLLRDIGVNREDAAAEVAKPFWLD